MPDGLKLTNSKIKVEFDGKEYEVNRANLALIAELQRKGVEIAKEKDAGADSRLAAYAIYLVLKPALPELTEDEVFQKSPAIELQDVLVALGFVNQQKMAILQKMRNVLESKEQTPTKE